MSYLVISFSHKNIDIKQREKLAFSSDDEKSRFIKKLLEFETTKELVLLSTCNRVEIIGKSSNIKQSSKNILENLSSYSNLSYDFLYDRADIYDGDIAVHHLFSVASALDSLVIGETQIVGQLKDAFRFSQSLGFCDQSISRVMHYAFKCAAQVRTATSLGTGSVSVASTAVAKAKELIGDKKGIKALVIGAGTMSELAVKHLLAAGFDVTIISRNIKKAQNLANSFTENIEVKPYDKLEELLEIMPVMITATSAPYPIITQENTPSSSINRYWFDIAVPRDIDEDISMFDLEIYSVDDLQEIVNKNMTQRSAQAKEAYTIVGRNTLEFFDWLKSLDIEPLIKDLYIKGDQIIDKKLENAIKKGYVPKEYEENIKKLCQTIITEYLHNPAKQLKTISRTKHCDLVVSSVQNMFSQNVQEIDYNCEHINKN
ncbi:glutamyl-tRNA reductase [Arcobacter porcinus]|uniref:Glutamyl-tRNA reductase n=1 Tax=Arcobacter porcinus TaxID=1935204 RepID=A0A5C2HM50_9BACT|nr:glutamyl-tRNA reductase [Arcobacter porcinus]OCL83505.1 Glutamyl-tRNA reductase [Arcobacter porcinus]OCL83724.1 Glutamyl-tRNA reductase [Arcobacter porcinus]OCL94343.1 Glutamyl-tRNA reductase [Aliarcobacter thereius]QEP41308.1 glutamyl-tRNA reductase [Arcobacter porcinus]